MGRRAPSRKQIEEGKAFEHVDRNEHRLTVMGLGQAPLLEFRMSEPERGARHVVVDHDSALALYDFLDAWFLQFPPGER